MVSYLFLTRSAFLLRSSRLADRKGQAIASSFLIGPNFKRRDSRGVGEIRWCVNPLLFTYSTY